MSVLEIRNVNVLFDGKDVLEDVSFDVQEGEMVSILGPSGCGKSTILKSIAGIIRPTSGDILISGESVLELPMEERGGVLVFQDYMLFPHMNIEKNIGFGLRMKGEKKGRIKKRVDELIGLFELEGIGKKYPKEISGGQRQRVAIARAIASRPKILLLDEPFSNLDIRLKDNMREFVKDMQKKLGITTILVTHDKEEAFMMSNRVGVIVDGKIAQFSTPKDIYERPSSKEVADFFGRKNYMPGNVHGASFVCVFGRFDAGMFKEPKGLMMVRPEDIRLSKHENGGIGGKIKKKTYKGGNIDYEVAMESQTILVQTQSVNDFEVEESVFLSLVQKDVNIYPVK